MTGSPLGGDGRTWTGQDIDEGGVRTREHIGQAIAGAQFPASADELLRQAEQAGATERVAAALRRLPGRGRFENVEAVWQALGGPEERRF